MISGLDNPRMGSRRKDLTSPCKGCSLGIKRPGFHDHCQEYQAFRETLEQMKNYHRVHGYQVYDPLAPKYRRDL